MKLQQDDAILQHQKQNVQEVYNFEAKQDTTGQNQRNIKLKMHIIYFIVTYIIIALNNISTIINNQNEWNFI